MMYKKKLKRLIDFSSAIFLFSLLLPIMIISGVVIYISSPGGILFKQIRVGKNEKKFELYKFRTMYENPDREAVQTRKGDLDITPAGSLMRRLKIDELPQLFNVIKGDMSLVGPRPCLPSTAEQAPRWACKRFEVAPGLTGLAQVNGNISLSWEQRWHYDIDYIEDLSFWLDCKILFKTVAVIFFGEYFFRSHR